MYMKCFKFCPYQTIQYRVTVCFSCSLKISQQVITEFCKFQYSYPIILENRTLRSFVMFQNNFTECYVWHIKIKNMVFIFLKNSNAVQMDVFVLQTLSKWMYKSFKTLSKQMYLSFKTLSKWMYLSFKTVSKWMDLSFKTLSKWMYQSFKTLSKFASFFTVNIASLSPVISSKQDRSVFQLSGKKVKQLIYRQCCLSFYY